MKYYILSGVGLGLTIGAIVTPTFSDFPLITAGGILAGWNIGRLMGSRAHTEFDGA